MKENTLQYDKQEGSEVQDMRFHCSKCTKSYKNKRHLYRHEKEECIDTLPRFKCPFCLHLFRRKYHLSRHIDARHRADGNNVDFGMEFLTT